MATTNLGRVSVVPKGQWNSGTEYKKLDIVTSNGNSYIAVLDNTNKAVTNTTYWQLVAEKGAKGDKGNTGQTGATGETGNGIASITKTDSVGLVDTYTITYTDGTTSTFQITNGEDGEVTQKQLDETNRGMNYYKLMLNDLPNEERFGISVSIPNTAKCPMSVKLIPNNLKQIETTGANIFKTANNIWSGSSASYVNYDSTKDIFTFHRDTGSDYLIQYGKLNIQPATDYVLYLDIKENTMTNDFKLITSGFLAKTSGDVLLSAGQTGIYTFPLLSKSAVTTYDMWLYCNSAGTLKTKIMIKKGTTAEEDDYEPYTNEIASPAPSYPQTIHSTTGDNEFKIMNSNLAKEEFDAMLTLQGSGDNRTVVSATAKMGQIVKVNPFTTYVIKGNFSTLADNNIRIAMFDEKPEVGSISTKFIYGSTGLIFSTDTNTEYLLLTNANTIDTVVTNLLLWEEEIHYGKDYIAHQEYSLPLTLGNSEYCAIGDDDNEFYEDEFYLATNSDTGLTAGKWYLKKNVGKVILNGTENWIASGSQPINGLKVYLSIQNLGTTGDNMFICNMLTPISQNEYLNASKQGLFIGTSNIFNVCLLNTTMTLSDWKTLLGTTNMITYYGLATPEYILLNNTLQSQLNEIYNWATSYQEQTNIYQENDDLPVIMDIKAIADLNKIIESLTNAIIEIGGE